jgi:hypothetical protein
MSETIEETVTASQRRRMFEETIGATPDNHPLWRALDQVINAATDARDEEHRAEVARLAAHFPSLEEAMLIVWEHITRGVAIAPCGACARD